MAILTNISGVQDSEQGWIYSEAANSRGGITDFLQRRASDSSFSDETIIYEQLDDVGNVTSGPTTIASYAVPPTDPNTGVPFVNLGFAFEPQDGVHAVAYTKSATADFDASDATAVKFQEFGNDGTPSTGVRSLTFGGRPGIKNLHQLYEGNYADFGNSFAVAYSTYDPATGRSQIRSQRFDTVGDALNGGVLRSFDDGTAHGLDFSTFAASNNPNSGGSPDYLLQYRVNGSESAVRATLLSPDLRRGLGSTVIQNYGPNGEVADRIDHYDHLEIGYGSADDYAVLTQTFHYTDAAGASHEAIALERVVPQTLQPIASTQFEVGAGTRASVGLEHLSNGNFLAIYNDGGQSYVKEFDSDLQQVGRAFALPQDNYGWNGIRGVGSDRFQIFWEQSNGIAHHATFQA